MSDDETAETESYAAAVSIVQRAGFLRMQPTNMIADAIDAAYARGLAAGRAEAFNEVAGGRPQNPDNDEWYEAGRKLGRAEGAREMRERSAAKAESMRPVHVYSVTDAGTAAACREVAAAIRALPEVP